MNKIFLYDEATGEFILNVPEIKLVGAFNDLWLLAKRQCEDDNVDENGIDIGNTLVISRFAEYCRFVYLFSDCGSPYKDYPLRDRKLESAADSMLTDEEADSPEIEAACKKWEEMQEQDRNVRILKAAQEQIDDLIEYFKIQNKLSVMRDGKPVYQAKNLISEMKELGSVSDYLDTCEERVRQGDSTSTNIRADAKEGLIIDFAKEKERRRKLAEMTQRHSDEVARARSYSAGTETVAVKKEAEKVEQKKAKPARKKPAVKKPRFVEADTTLSDLVDDL